MKKLKLYLDTSVISHLQADDAPDQMNSTIKLWQEIIRGDYDIFISRLTLAEIQQCDEPKKTFMLENLNKIVFNNLEITEEIEVLALKYIENYILSPKYTDDALHIAVASVENCDYIISWNFKHMVKVKTIMGINGVNKLFGYKEIGIVSPDNIIEEEEE